MTWVFHFFVFMQIWNMVCARKIHDEFNILEGITENLSFVAIWLFICIGQILISFSGKIFRLSPYGLDWAQHLTAVGFALAVFLVNFLTKCLPDWIIPFQLGPDHVFEREYGAKKEEKSDGAVDDEKNAEMAKGGIVEANKAINEE